MADTKLSGLSAITTLADADLIYVVDSSTSPISSKKITYANLEARLRDATLITDLGTVTGASGDFLMVLDVSASPQVLKKILISDIENATHTGDVTGSGALTIQPVAVSGQGSVTVAGTDEILVVDVSASPQVLGKTTAQAIADLRTLAASDISDQGAVTAAAGDQLLGLDVSASPNALAKLTAQDVANLRSLAASDITGQAADSPMAAAAGDLLLIADISASPVSLKQVTAQSIADLGSAGVDWDTAQTNDGFTFDLSATSPVSTFRIRDTASPQNELLKLGDGNATFKLGDAAGSNKLSVQDSDGVEVVKIDSDGIVFTQGQMLSSVADGASAVAFDLQTDSTYAAAGANLLRLGNNTTTVLDFSFQGGIDHVNSGASTAAHSQSLNLNWSASGTKTSSGQFSTVIGVDNTASGTYSFAAGFSCTASGNDGSVSLGRLSSASGQYGSAAIGNGCSATQATSFAFGSSAAATASSAMALGIDSSNTISSSVAIGHTKFATTGDAQTWIIGAKNTTTDATQTTLLAKTFAGTQSLVIPADTTWCFTGLVVARSDEADGNLSCGWKFEGVLYRDESNNTVIQGVTVTNIYNGSTSSPQWSVAVEADDTNEALAIKVTGEAATNIRWLATIYVSHVTYA